MLFSYSITRILLTIKGKPSERLCQRVSIRESELNRACSPNGLWRWSNRGARWSITRQRIFINPFCIIIFTAREWRCKWIIIETLKSPAICADVGTNNWYVAVISQTLTWSRRDFGTCDDSLVFRSNRFRFSLNLSCLLHDFVIIIIGVCRHLPLLERPFNKIIVRQSLCILLEGRK